MTATDTRIADAWEALTGETLTGRGPWVDADEPPEGPDDADIHERRYVEWHGQLWVGR